MNNKFLIKWFEYLVSGNPKINKTPTDNKKIRCTGDILIEAPTYAAAKKKFLETFPDARIVSMENF